MGNESSATTAAVIAFLEARRDGNYREMGRQVALADIARQRAGEVVRWGENRYQRRLHHCTLAGRLDLIEHIPGAPELVQRDDEGGE